MNEGELAKEARRLLRQIIEGATKSDSSLGETLRLCMRLGSVLKNQELTTWARYESTGYLNSDHELPDYRKLPVEVRGHFFGPFQSGIKNAHIPQGAIDEKHRDSLFTAYIHFPVGEIEHVANKKDGGDSLQMMWSADTIAYYQQQEIYSNNLVLASAWKVLSRDMLAGVLEIIRARILDFALKLDSELESVEDENHFELKPAEVVQLFQTTVYGGNVAISGLGDVSQTVNSISKGNFESLSRALSELGVSRNDIEDLKRIVKSEDLQNGNMGPKASSWLSKVVIGALKSTGEVAIGTVSGLIAQAIARYYGIG